MYSGANTSFGVTSKPNGIYYYRVRASNGSGTSGWTTGATGCVVFLPPGAPATVTVPASSITGDYTVTWDAVPTASSYEIEEDVSASFTSPVSVYSGSATSFDVSGKPDGTYYYRARAVNSAGSSVFTDGANGCVVTLAPDLRAQSVSVVAAPVTVEPKETFEVTWTIVNNGGAPGTASYSILLSDTTIITIADAEALSDTTLTVAPGATESLTVTCTVPAQQPPGDYYVGLYIDAANMAATSDRDVTVPAPVEAQSCGCSPVGGTATPADILGMLLPFLLWALVVFSTRRQET
ncbi:MAG: hypothetical protein ACYTFG_11180 [Planctomycetota bacterium]